jgi:hypothetical protein
MRFIGLINIELNNCKYNYLIALNDYYDIINEIRAFYGRQIISYDDNDENDMLNYELKRCVNLVLYLEEHEINLKRYIEAYMIFIHQKTEFPIEIIDMIFSYLIN